MIEIVVKRRDGQVRTVAGTPGFTLMETIRDVGDLMALCGGMCSCATCHVHVEADASNLLPEVNEDEDQLLDGSNHRQATSRLSCQIVLTQAMNGMLVTIAPED